MTPPRSTAAALSLGIPKAFDALQDRLWAIPEDQVMVVRTDPGAAAKRVRRAYRRVRPLRAALREALPQFDADRLDELPDLAEVVQYTDRLHRSRAADTGQGRRAAAHRKKLIGVARGLAEAGHLPRGAVEALASGRGNQRLAEVLPQLGALLRQRWPDIESQCWLTDDDLEACTTLAESLTAESAHPGPHEGHARGSHAELRARAFTLMALSYDEVRRAVTYLRWREGDAIDYAPTMFRRRRPYAT